MALGKTPQGRLRRNSANGNRRYGLGSPDAKYNAKPHVKKKRAQQNAARATLKKAGVKVAGKDVNHKTPVSKGGTNARGNLNVQSKTKNRSYKRTSTGAVARRRLV